MKMRLIDDDFMTIYFDGYLEGTELVVRTILERDDITVTQVVAQKEYKGTNEHSIRLDILAKDKNGDLYDIEIQRSDSGASTKRARYYSGMLDRGILKPKESYDKLIDTYVIFITENDIYGAGLPLYHVERQVKELGKDFGDGAHIIYVNGHYRGEDDIGRLMHDFMCSKADEMYNDLLADRFDYFKNSEKGRGSMCKLIEDRIEDALKTRVDIALKTRIDEIRRETEARVEKETAERVEKETAERVEKETTERVERETLKTTVLRMLGLGKFTLDEVALVTNLPIGEVQKIAEGLVV
ncbi:MAG: PD-(D/E)XK nuclease family transposase [Clostridia bacterium]|nr:PD-(D/E)XK nuclease family transposase [Clostridia bacterium]